MGSGTNSCSQSCPKLSMTTNHKLEASCCIFWSGFGCCALQLLVKICLFHIFCIFMQNFEAKLKKKNEAKKGVYLTYSHTLLDTKMLVWHPSKRFENNFSNSISWRLVKTHFCIWKRDRPANLCQPVFENKAKMYSFSSQSFLHQNLAKRALGHVLMI